MLITIIIILKTRRDRLTHESNTRHSRSASSKPAVII